MATERDESYQDHLLGALVMVKRRILIIVQNLPLPFDRRVWLECQALVSAGYRVVAVCPKASGDPSYQVIDAVEMVSMRVSQHHCIEPLHPGIEELLAEIRGGVAEARHRPGLD